MENEHDSSITEKTFNSLKNQFIKAKTSLTIGFNNPTKA